MPRKTPVAQKHRAISRQKKMEFSTPVELPWDSPPPPPESVRTYNFIQLYTDYTTQPQRTPPPPPTKNFNKN